MVPLDEQETGPLQIAVDHQRGAQVHSLSVAGIGLELKRVDRSCRACGQPNLCEAEFVVHSYSEGVNIDEPLCVECADAWARTNWLYGYRGEGEGEEEG